MAVVQFGFAISEADQMDHLLTHGTTSGTCSSYLKSEALSITRHHDAIARGTNSLDTSDPAANNATS